MKKWQTLSSEEVYKTPWIRVRRDEVINHAGKQLTYSIIELNKPSCIIVPVSSAGELLMEYSYRYSLDRSGWELPAGHSDGDDPLKAAKRELHEETGYISDDWERIGRQYSIVGMGDFPMDVFIARNIHYTGNNEEDVESIEQTKFMSLKEVEELIRKGDIVDNITITAIYMAKLHGLK